MDVVCIGLLVCDIIAKPVERTIFAKDLVRPDFFKILPGGDSLNAAVNMSKLGLDVALVGVVGKDPLGEFLLEEASSNGVNIKGVVKSEKFATSTSLVIVEECGERHFVYYGEANDNLSIEDIDFDCISDTKIVHIGSAMALKTMDGSGIANLFKWAKASGKITSMDVTFDSSGKWLEKIEEALYFTDIFMPSYNEAKMISGADSTSGMRDFFKNYGLKVLAVKLGEKGCYVTDFNNEYHINVIDNINVVDTTGAGDAFVSGFLTGMIKELNLYECGLLGNSVAAHCVTEIGATSGTKSLSNTLDFIKNNLQYFNNIQLSFLGNC